MEMMVHPAAWRCGYYLFSWSLFYKDTNDLKIIYFFEKHVKHTFGNGFSFNRIQAIRVLEGFFASKKHALIFK
jgi:hypothetical protein